MTPAAMIWLAMAVLILPLRWMLAWVIASGFHELCHYFALRICAGSVHKLRIDTGGAVMSVSELSKGKELICALAGPLGALLLLPLVRWFPAVAVCALFQSAYNLLPLYPLDGGRALRCILQMIATRQTAQKICDVVSVIFLVLTWIGAVYTAFWMNLGIIPLIFAMILHFQTKKGKIPCKPEHKWLQ